MRKFLLPAVAAAALFAAACGGSGKRTVEVDGQEDHKVEQGESFSIKFDEPGTYHYVCTLHSQDMDGEVIVK